MMPKGTRVKMTHSALRAGLDGRLSRKTGFVKSWSATYVHCLNVVRDGCKKSECFSAVWWERDTSHNDIDEGLRSPASANTTTAP